LISLNFTLLPINITEFNFWYFYSRGKIKENEHPFDSIKRELFEELELEIIPIHEITRYPFKKFNLIFILCEPINPKKIKLKEHLRFNWVQSDELLDYNFIEGDIKFIKSF